MITFPYGLVCCMKTRGVVYYKKKKKKNTKRAREFVHRKQLKEREAEIENLQAQASSKESIAGSINRTPSVTSTSR